MPSYRVQFSKNVLSSDGHPFKAAQRIIKIDDVPSPDDAIRAAWLQFDQATHGLARHCADQADAEIVDGVPPGR
jgi:hypothetical protein